MLAGYGFIGLMNRRKCFRTSIPFTCFYLVFREPGSNSELLSLLRWCGASFPAAGGALYGFLRRRQALGRELCRFFYSPMFSMGLRRLSAGFRPLRGWRLCKLRSFSIFFDRFCPFAVVGDRLRSSGRLLGQTTSGEKAR